MVDLHSPDTDPRHVDPLALPNTFPVQVFSRMAGIGYARTYEMIKAGTYPIRVIPVGRRFVVSKHDVLDFLGYGQDEAAS